MEVTLNHDQKLYVIPLGTGQGFSCLGFDVCRERTLSYAKWLGIKLAYTLPYGSPAAYQLYEETLAKVRERNERTGERCPVELTPQLIGLEGKRVEVTDSHGETRRFWVGKSTGFVPVHLEISRRNSSGGPAVMGAPFKSVRVVGVR